MVNIKERTNTTKNNTISVHSVTITFISFKRHRCIDNSNGFYLLFCRAKALDNKELNPENSKPRRESRIMIELCIL